MGENWLKWEKKRMCKNPKYIHRVKIYTEVSKAQSWQKKKKKKYTSNIEDRLRSLPRMLYSEFRNLLVASKGIPFSIANEFSFFLRMFMWNFSLATKIVLK